jgi:dTDP-glucose 4,6-dehydratase/UDP-glucuronate decarboxylase
MKTILVTGGAGFIGTNLCKKLLDAGHKVIAVDNFITSSGSNLKELKTHPNFTFIKHDIVKPFPAKIKDLNPKIKAIFHLACPTGVPNLLTLGEEMLLTCSTGTRNVLELAREHKAKFLLTSSSEVYGDPEVFPQTEDYTGNVQPNGFRSTYEEGKRFSESLVAFYVRKYKLDAKIVRIFNTYGPHMTMTDTRVIPNFINQIQKNKPLTVQGKGTQKRTFCYVDDLVDGFLTIIEKGTPGEAYNLGGDQEYSVKELAEHMIKLGGNPKVKIDYIPRPEHDHQARRPELKKVKKLGWKQKIKLDQGLKKALEWYGI